MVAPARLSSQAVTAFRGYSFKRLDDTPRVTLDSAMRSLDTAGVVCNGRIP